MPGMLEEHLCLGKPEGNLFLEMSEDHLGLGMSEESAFKCQQSIYA